MDHALDAASGVDDAAAAGAEDAVANTDDETASDGDNDNPSEEKGHENVKKVSTELLAIKQVHLNNMSKKARAKQNVSDAYDSDGDLVMSDEETPASRTTRRNYQLIVMVDKKNIAISYAAHGLVRELLEVRNKLRYREINGDTVTTKTGRRKDADWKEYNLARRKLITQVKKKITADGLDAAEEASKLVEYYFQV